MNTLFITKYLSTLRNILQATVQCSRSAFTTCAVMLSTSHFFLVPCLNFSHHFTSRSTHTRHGVCHTSVEFRSRHLTTCAHVIVTKHFPRVSQCTQIRKHYDFFFSSVKNFCESVPSFAVISYTCVFYSSLSARAFGLCLGTALLKNLVRVST